MCKINLTADDIYESCTEKMFWVFFFNVRSKVCVGNSLILLHM